MRWTYKLPLRIGSLFRQKTADQGLDEELRFHLEREIAVKIAAGVPPDEARFAAMREFGGVEQVREECRDMRSVNWIQDFVQDLRFGIRMLLKSPGFTVIAVLTLALGIGANTAIFSFIDSVLMRALPVSDAQNLVLLKWSAHGKSEHLATSSYGDCPEDRSPNVEGGCSISEPFFREIQSLNLFSDLAAFSGGGGLVLTGNGSASVVDDVEYVSGDYFQTLGERPESGRFISSADDTQSASTVVVLSHNYWKTAFGASPSAIGKTVYLNRVPFTIIGVADPRFDALSPGNEIQMWLPLSSQMQIDRPWDNRDLDANSWWLVMVGRVKPGVTRGQAQAAVNAAFVNEAVRGAKQVFKPEANPTMTLVPAQTGLTGFSGELAAPIYILMMAVGVVLLIACANVAGLLLSRASARQKEMAVRFALGARRGRIVRQLLTESLMLSIAGGAVGLFFATWIMEAIRSFVISGHEEMEGASVMNAGLDSRVLLFTFAVAIFTGILFGLAPALRGMKVDLTPALKDASGNLPASRSIARWFSMGNALVVAQVALTVVVLAGAGLLVRTLQNLKTVNPGFDTRNLLVFDIDPTSVGYKRAEVDRFYGDLRSRLASVPGVTSVSYSWRPLLAGSLWTTGFDLPGYSKDNEPSADMLPVGSDFFHTMGIPLKLGRELNSQDFMVAAKIAEARDAQDARAGAALKNGSQGLAEKNNTEMGSLQPMPVIVNEALLRKYFAKQNPIGIRFGGHSAKSDAEPGATPGYEIVGVVGDAKYNRLRRDVEPTIYAPFTGSGASFTLRTAGNPSNFIPQIRGIVAQMDNNLAVNRVRTETQQIEEQLVTERLIAKLSSFFGILALLLSCIGLYGLLAYEVSRRTREIGIRMALGANANHVMRLVIGQGLVLAATGAAVGIATALGVTRFLQTLLYGVHAADPLTYAAVAFCLATVALLACYIPARRATHVDPLVALRYE
jgi:predicted permease